MLPLVELELAGVTTSDELHQLLAAKLGFPSYYGNNWDAFWDCVRDPEQSSMPSVLRIRGWNALRFRLPRDARVLRELLGDLHAERRDCRVEWVSSSG
jgi:ribonuclease inhibitor